MIWCMATQDSHDVIRWLRLGKPSYDPPEPEGSTQGQYPIDSIRKSLGMIIKKKGNVRKEKEGVEELKRNEMRKG